VSRYKRLASNALLIFVGNLGSKLIGLAMLPFYTRWLSVADYGVTDVITIYTTLLLSVLTFCIAEAVFVFPKGKDEDKQKEYFSSGLVFSLVMISIVAIFLYLADVFFDVSNYLGEIGEYVWSVYWMVVASLALQYFTQFSRSIDKIKVYAISGIILTTFTAILAFALIPEYGVRGFIAAQILSLIVTMLYVLVYSKAYTFFAVKSVKYDICREMLRYSTPLIPNGVMWWLVAALNRPIIESHYGMDSVGLFSVANKIPSLIAVVFSVFVYAWQVSVMEEFKKKGYREFYNRILRLLFLVLTLLSCGLAIFSEFLVSMVVDERYIDAWKYVPLLSIAVLFSSLAGFSGTNFSAAKVSKYYFYSSFWGALTSVILSFILIPMFNLYGAAISIILSHATTAALRIKYSWQFVEITQWYAYVVMLVINVFVVLAVFFISDIWVKTLVFVMMFLILIAVNANILKDVKLFVQTFINKLNKGRS
jgi:O-antigen/teichoic acid export membrane protein